MFGFIRGVSMVTGKCDNKDCTVSETGLCLLSHKNPTDCPHFQVITGEMMPESFSAQVSETIIAGKQKKSFVRQFHSGFELGIQDAAEIMRGRYVYLIGILGVTDVGKTCFLSSLYLLTSHGGIKPDYVFAGSLTLQGFEDRARRLRKWKGGLLPDKLAEHTYLSDPRNPSFMHLALREGGSQGKRIELLLTDLPGEWSSSLIDHADTAIRFAFLRRADGIIYLIEGPLVVAAETRHVEIHRAKLMLDRLSQLVLIDRDTPLVLLISKCDRLLDMQVPAEVIEIRDYALEIGFDAEIIMSAAFSSKPLEVKSGTGVLEAVKSVIDHDIGTKTLQGGITVPQSAERSFGRFRL
jgi:hypothetical protein